MSGLDPKEYNRRYVGWFHLVAATNEKRIEDATVASVEEIVKLLRKQIDLESNQNGIVELSEKIFQLAAVKLTKKRLQDVRQQSIMKLVEEKLAETGSPVVDNEIQKFQCNLEAAHNPLVEIADQHLEQSIGHISESIRKIKPSIGENALNALLAQIDKVLDQKLGTVLAVN